MKKNILRSHSLLLLPLIASSSLLSMEKETITITNPLAESVMVTQIPTTRGLGILRSAKDWIWAEETNIHTDLVNGKYDPLNSSYPRKLNTSIENLVRDSNDNQLTKIFTACRQKYPKQIKIGDSEARMAHELLVDEKHDKQRLLKEAIETKDKNFIAKENNLLEDLQESIQEKIAEMQKDLTNYSTKRDALVTKECDEIRRLKKGLVILHHLNKTFVLPEDVYCSDEEKDENNVETSYNDRHLLEKIEIAFKMNETITKTENLLLRLAQLEQELKDIQPLVYSKI